jgi:hypothetical protein
MFSVRDSKNVKGVCFDTVLHLLIAQGFMEGVKGLAASTPEWGCQVGAQDRLEYRSVK